MRRIMSDWTSRIGVGSQSDRQASLIGYCQAAHGGGAQHCAMKKRHQVFRPPEGEENRVDNIANDLVCGGTMLFLCTLL